MHTIDFIVFLVFTFGVVIFGCSFFRKGGTADEFTSAGHSIPGWVVGMSIFATYVSSISYIGYPGKAFAADWNAFVFSLSIPIASYFAAKYFVPFYRKSGSVSAYTFLEEKFGAWARLYASACYLLTQIARMGSILYLLAVPMYILMGWDIHTVIILTSIGIIIYSMLGGLKAVIWADAIQGIILIGGALLCLGLLLFRMPEGPMQAFDLAVNSPMGNKFSLGEFSADLTKSTFWVCLIYGIFINLQNYGIDQNYVQRYHAAKTDKDARFSALFGGYLFIPVSALFFLIGSALYSYYTANPSLLPADMAAKPDYVFPYFIVSELPVGLRGLLIASIFAAGMSTVSTSVTSAATIILTDYFKPFFKGTTDRHHLLVLRISSVAVGVLGIIVAIAMLSVESIIDAWWTLSSIFSGGMLGLFLLGCIARNINRTAAVIGCICGVLVIAWISLAGMWNLPGTHLHEYLAIVLGTTTIFLIGFLATILIKKRRVMSVILLMMVFLPMKAQFGEARWIGAITKAEAHLPEGRTFSGTTLKDSAVKAAWAAVNPLSRQSIMLEKTFRHKRKNWIVKKATVNICGLGFYELSINNHKVGNAVLAPHWSDYDKTVFYNTFDVTDLCRGRSAYTDLDIRVLLGNGFYNEQGGRYHKMKISFGPPTMLFSLHMEYENGKTADIVSDESWIWRESPITFNSIYGGEDYDARLESVGLPKTVVVQEAPKGKLCQQIAEPIKIMEYYNVDSRLSSGVFDMGQNLAGFPEISISGKAGQQVKLTVGETLDNDGHISQKQTGRPHYYTYTLKGKGTETWHPHFTYYGFRYVEVEGAVMEGEENPNDLPVIHRLRSCFIYNSARKIGTFECSNPLFNDAYRLIDRAVRSNWQAVWTDCPHREKLGWLEQDWLNGEGLVNNYDCRTMLEQTVRQISDAQYPNGAVPTTAPQYTIFPGKTWGKPFNESPEWGGTIVALPVLYSRHYQDISLIKQYFPQMLRYVDYLATQAQPSVSGLDVPYLLNQGLGDWYDYVEGEKAGFAKNTPVAYVSTAHFYRWTSEVARAAGLLRAADETIDEARQDYLDDCIRRLQARADSIRHAFNRTFYNPTTHLYATGSQCAQAIALELELVPDGDRQVVLDSLLADIHRHGDRLTTGDVGNRYLFNCLAHNGQTELLYKILNHYETPGYGYQIRQGMTTLTEQWNPKFGSSMNHFMMGHLMNLLIPHFVGIQSSGKKHVIIRPHPAGDLTWCKGSTELACGKVSVSWKKADGQFLLDIDVPEGATADVIMPYSGKNQTVGAGHHSFAE